MLITEVTALVLLIMLITEVNCSCSTDYAYYSEVTSLVLLIMLITARSLLLFY